MKKISWQTTNNQKTGKDFKEYDKEAYQCIDDDIWVTSEIPIAKNS